MGLHSKQCSHPQEEPMILDMTFGTSDLARAIRFYDPVFASLGIGRAPDWPKGWAGWGAGYGEGSSLWLCPPFNGMPPTAGNGTMITLFAKNEKEVHEFHAAALANGGSDEGPPGTRPYYEPTFYVAYVRDPDGNKLACAFLHHQPD
jgi:catechol 2,3-dioxygenase-like lactoylglutathione lyase family enzyme